MKTAEQQYEIAEHVNKNKFAAYNKNDFYYLVDKIVKIIEKEINICAFQGKTEIKSDNMDFSEIKFDDFDGQIVWNEVCKKISKLGYKIWPLKFYDRTFDMLSVYWGHRKPSIFNRLISYFK